MTHVQLFITCLTDSFFPQTGEAVVNIFHRLGINVDFAREQTCCGQPGFNAGLRQTALPLGKHTSQVVERSRGPVVIPSGSCAAMVLQESMSVK